MQWSEWRKHDGTAHRQAGVTAGQLRCRTWSTSAPAFRAPPRGCCEGRREPSLGDPMKHRRFVRSASKASWADSWPRWDCDVGPEGRQGKARGHRCGRHRRRRPPRRGPASRKVHPRARQAGAVPSPDQHRTVNHRRWISLGSGRTAIPHPGRTQPNLDSTRSGDPTHRTPSGGTWT